MDYHKPAARVSRKFLSLEGLTSSGREDRTEDGYCRANTEVFNDYPLIKGEPIPSFDRSYRVLKIAY